MKKRILHYMYGIPPVRGGGLIRYATDLMKSQLEHDMGVLLLIPGKITRNVHHSRIKKCARYEKIETFEIENPLPIPMANGINDIDRYTTAVDRSIYKAFLDETKPDLIHVHSIMGLHREFLQEAKNCGIPVVFTTHDYFGLCPTINLVFAEKCCIDKEWKHCELCCTNAYTDKRLRIEQSRLYRFYRRHGWIVNLFHRGPLKKSLKKVRSPHPPVVKEVCDNQSHKDYSKLREYYYDMFHMVDFFHFNSAVAREVYETRLGCLDGKILQISHMGIKDCRKKRTYVKDVLRVGFIGGWTVEKGFFVLFEVISNLQHVSNGQLELHVYSETEELQEAFVRNHRKFTPQELSRVMDEIDVLVVPSLWKETFGFVVLEAVSFGVPVIVSENVGAKIILETHPGIGRIYDGSAAQLGCVIRELLEDHQLLTDMNQNIMNMEFDISFARHMNDILQLYEKLCS